MTAQLVQESELVINIFLMSEQSKFPVKLKRLKLQTYVCVLDTQLRQHTNKNRYKIANRLGFFASILIEFLNFIFLFSKMAATRNRQRHWCSY